MNMHGADILRCVVKMNMDLVRTPLVVRRLRRVLRGCHLVASLSWRHKANFGISQCGCLRRNLRERPLA